ncbi:hypothetical protein SteCoe_19046 [Stentor coeruleus]|uniref:LITAF domain-containing protein n=1 Tax=Stentor coeruleus TaxID=5963 RepID=A0A1R2BV95_9CILI|nr:hypothetical protein SteCoe_19046 [Stentor coeruleus]
MQKDSLESETLKYKMSEDSKDLDEDVEVLEKNEVNQNMLCFMKTMTDADRIKRKSVDIFEDNNNSIHPTSWGKESQTATCRKCGKTGETIANKKCGIGNACCSCCFVIFCMCFCIPCLCCFSCDVHHYCSHCKEPLGISTFI